MSPQCAGPLEHPSKNSYMRYSFRACSKSYILRIQYPSACNLSVNVYICSLNVSWPWDIIGTSYTVAVKYVVARKKSYNMAQFSYLQEVLHTTYSWYVMITNDVLNTLTPPGIVPHSQYAMQWHSDLKPAHKVADSYCMEEKVTVSSQKLLYPGKSCRKHLISVPKCM